MKKVFFYFIFSIIFFSSPKIAFAANLINASSFLSNSIFSYPTILTLTFTTTSNIPANGYILITLPLYPNGYDLKKIDPNDISISSATCANDWGIISQNQVGFESKIRINKLKNNCAAGSNINIQIGNSLHLLFNPPASNKHTRGQADIYGINIRTLDEVDNIIDEVILKTAINEAINSNLNVMVTVGKLAFNLYGYASPKAKVILEGRNISDRTDANDKGYFQFKLVPALSAKEVCIWSRDQFGRTSNPVCIPPIPNKYTANIGPVLIPPTLSLDKKNYKAGDEVKLSGQTIPNTSVDISFYENEKTRLSLLPSVLAFSFPILNAKSDSKGNFSISLPSSTSQLFRLFAQTNLFNSKSSRSNILLLKISSPPINFLILIIIITESLMLLIFVLRRYLHPVVIVKNKALMAREREEIILRQKFELLSKL